MKYIFEGKLLSEDTLRMIYKTSFDCLSGRSFEQYVEHLQKENIIAVLIEKQETEKKNMKTLHLTNEQISIVSIAISYLILEGSKQLRNDISDKERENLQWHINNFYKLQNEIQKQLKEQNRMKQQAQYPCRNCIYFHTCGENTRTEYCAGRTTKSEKKEENKRNRKGK